MLLTDAGASERQPPAPLASPALSDAIEDTAWGPARRILAPVTVAGAALRWDMPARELGSDEPSW